MKKLLLPATSVLVLFSGGPSTLVAQEVAKISQALPFDAKGKVGLVESSSSVQTSTTTTTTTPISITAGGKISTDESGSAAVSLGSLGTVQMERNTEIQIPAEPDAGHSLELLKGKLFLQINGEQLLKNKSGEFRLKTPSALLAVKGTRFFVDCNKKSETVGLHEGMVHVTDALGKSSVELLPGQGVTVSPGNISPPAPLSAKDQNGARAYESASLTLTPLLLTFDPNTAGGSSRKPVAAQYFLEGRLLTPPLPGNLTDWEFLRFHNFSPTFSYVNGRQAAVDLVGPLSITPEGAVVMTTTYQYVPVSKSSSRKKVAAPPVLGDLRKGIQADIHFKGRAWRSAHVGKSDVGPLLGLQMRLRLKGVGRVTCSIYGSGSSSSNATFDAPSDLPEAGIWERDCVLPVKLDKTGEESRYNLYIYIYPEGPMDAAGNLRSGTAELTVLNCALVSKAR